MTLKNQIYLAGRLALAALLSASLVGCSNLSTVAPKTDSPATAKVESVPVEVRQALAPTGALRVGVYLGSPTSWVKDPKTGESVGIAMDLGKELAKRLTVPVQLVEFDRVAQVLDAVKGGQVDLTFTNATAVRAKDLDLTAPWVQLERGHLVVVHRPAKSVSDSAKRGNGVGGEGVWWGV